MNVAVLGLTHLGTVTAACCSRVHKVWAWDNNPDVVKDRFSGIAGFPEINLKERMMEGFSRELLFVSDSVKAVCEDADIVWLCYDTPVNDSDESNVGFVLDRFHEASHHIKPDALVVVSSQLPVGTIMDLERRYPFEFACAPENLVRGRAVDCFERPRRIVLGFRDKPGVRSKLSALLAHFCQDFMWMSVESAEMTKHTLNGFLGLSIAYINEIAEICRYYGADPVEVSMGVRSDPRIGRHAYLSPGGPFAGGTLGRDLKVLGTMKTEHDLPLLASVWKSNHLHKQRHEARQT